MQEDFYYNAPYATVSGQAPNALVFVFSHAKTENVTFFLNSIAYQWLRHLRGLHILSIFTALVQSIKMPLWPQYLQCMHDARNASWFLETASEDEGKLGALFPVY